MSPAASGAPTATPRTARTTKISSSAYKPDPNNLDKEQYNVYRYSGKRWDQASQSYDMGFRDYSPGLNRFLTLDMYNGALQDMRLTTDPWTNNRYAFTGGNPVTYVEVDGHCYALDDGGCLPSSYDPETSVQSNAILAEREATRRWSEILSKDPVLRLKYEDQIRFQIAQQENDYYHMLTGREKPLKKSEEDMES